MFKKKSTRVAVLGAAGLVLAATGATVASAVDDNVKAPYVQTGATGNDDGSILLAKHLASVTRGSPGRYCVLFKIPVANSFFTTSSNRYRLFVVSEIPPRVCGNDTVGGPAEVIPKAAKDDLCDLSVQLGGVVLVFLNAQRAWP
ncbi:MULTISPECIES: hypothetical protein [Streptomyces]|uniref:Secreted protein n=1 Tax=Streptomyces fimbriatus TaxID=68197 RepID=A0ABW0DFN6_STRFI